MAEEKKPKKRGPKSKWKDEFLEQAGKLALLGMSDAQMANVFGVCASTFDKWKAAKPELLQTLKNNKALLDSDVAKSLYQRAIGFTDIDGKYWPPDPTSMIFWLKNRQKEIWRDKPSIDNKEDNTTPVKVEIVSSDASKNDKS